MDKRMQRTRRRPLGGALVAIAALPALAQDTVRISETAAGGTAMGHSWRPSISSGGRFVAFQSTAANLAASDNNGTFDVFVRDRSTGAVDLISVSASGGSGNDDSQWPSISGDGMRVAFASRANDLGPYDFNAKRDVYVYVYDRGTGVMTLASVRSNGAQGNDESYDPDLSADGRFVAFTSIATNLVDGTGTVENVFVHDLRTGTTELVSRENNGQVGGDDSYWASISADGRFVAFTSEAELVSSHSNWFRDVFVRDRLLLTTEVVSLTSINTQLIGHSEDPDISADGRYVAFTTEGPIGATDGNNTKDVVVRDRQGGPLPLFLASSASLCCGTASGTSRFPSLSADGRYVVFSSDAPNILSGAADTNGEFDVFRVDRQTGQKLRLSVTTGGAQSQGPADRPAISADGSQVAFRSSANDLVPGDTGFDDVFVRNEGPTFPELYCSGKPNSLGCVPYLSFEGTPSASSAGTFKVRGHDFLPNAPGLLVYGTSGRLNLDFHGGKLCVKLPFTRWLGFKKAFDTDPAPCTGLLSRNFNKRIQSNVDPALTAGGVVNAQWLQRDQADPAGFGDALSNGLEFAIGP